MSTTMQASPAKLRDGSWGARVAGTVTTGTILTITTAAGKSWQATVERVIWTDGQVSIVATASRPSSAHGHGSYPTIGARMAERQRSTGWTGCRCGSIEGNPRDSDCRQCQFDSE